VLDIPSHARAIFNSGREAVVFNEDLCRGLSMKEAIIYGAGGHAKVIVDIIHRSRKYEIVGLFDDDPAKQGQTLVGEQIIGTFAELPRFCNGDTGLIIGIGDNRGRYGVWRKLRALQVTYARAIHPSAVMGEEVVVGEGTVVMAGAVINCCTSVGAHSIVNTRSSVGHDCEVGDFAHIAPGVVLCGGVHVGNGALVGTGAIVLPCTTIGQEAVIGSGAVVARDVPDAECVVGVPAKPLKTGRRSQSRAPWFMGDVEGT
jgi:sugar O-acyltransferase (sialic acid O-acetyltransferase NeuD family)